MSKTRVWPKTSANTPVWLVTGASGYLASELCRRIKADLPHVHLIASDAKPPAHKAFDEFLVGSLDEPGNEVVREIGGNRIDLVVHLAGVAVEGWCHEHPIETCESNIRSVYLLLEAARRSTRGTRFILSTTDKVYGRDASAADPYCEDDPLLPKNIYETSKVCADLIAQSYSLAYGLPLAIVRFSNIYGGVDRNSSRLFPAAIERLEAGLAPKLRLTADGAEYTRDFIHICDVVDGVMKVAEGLLASDPRVVGEAFNISSGREYRVRDVLEEIIADCKPGARYREVKGGVDYLEIVNQCASNEKMRRVLGWAPKVTLTEGLRRMRAALAERSRLAS